MMQIIHLFTDMSKLNFGVWNAALFGESELALNFKISTSVWVCSGEKHELIPASLPFRVLTPAEMSCAGFTALLKKGFSKEDTILVTHGSWKKPTELGAFAARAGYRWIYTPHGMLEPWSLRQGYLKKLIYFSMFEKRAVRHAHALRAVSKPEYERLGRKFLRPVGFIPNGVTMPPVTEKPVRPIVFLFMARLHHKKGILPLVNAWTRCMKDQGDMKLIIAGPDEGELEKIAPFITGNISYAGAVYNDEKAALLKNAHYYILPSHSEGFPTSVVEAMANGCIPLISEGCNFPEVFEHGLGYLAEPDAGKLEELFIPLREKEFDRERAARVAGFIDTHYTERSLLPAMASFYKSIL